MDGASCGLELVREGWEIPSKSADQGSEEGEGPAVGYSIRRADVGLWIMERVVKGFGDWNGKMVSLTY